MRVWYSLVLYLAMPWVLARMWWRGMRLPAYRDHWDERFGRVPAGVAKRAIVLHAVSVGELRAAQPLVEAIAQRWPARPLLLSTTTPTGRQTAARLYPGIDCVYLPWDLPGATRRFLDRLQPAALVIMETELWPNLYRAAAARGVALFMFNARLSARSFAGYRRLARLTRETLAGVAHIGAQSAEDATRFIALGASDARVSVTGNLKFDVSLPADYRSRRDAWRQRLGDTRPTWIAASTHPGEEALLLEAHRHLLQQCPDVLLLLVPRHPERGGELSAVCRRQALSACRLGQGENPHGGHAVAIADVLGELVYLYGCARAAFVAGSLVDRGGHNPLEAVLAGVPVAVGPYRSNFADIYRLLLDNAAAVAIDTPRGLGDWLSERLVDHDAPDRKVELARQLVEQQRGATQRSLRVIEERFSD